MDLTFGKGGNCCLVWKTKGFGLWPFKIQRGLTRERHLPKPLATAQGAMVLKWLKTDLDEISGRNSLL